MVLRVFDHGEADKILSLYSLREGRLTAIAKGAKRSKIRFVNKLEPFSLLAVDLTLKRDRLAFLDQAELLSPLAGIRHNAARFTVASAGCELLLYWTREHDPDPAIYQLAGWYMTGLDAGKDPCRLLALFLIRLLNLTGYAPPLESCVACGRELTALKGPFSYLQARHGLLCRSCMGRRPVDPIHISLATCRLLARAQQTGLNKLDRLQFSRQSLQESLGFLFAYSMLFLQRDLHCRSSLTALLPHCFAPLEAMLDKLPPY